VDEIPGGGGVQPEAVVPCVCAHIVRRQNRGRSSCSPVDNE
jgi:hypothetical protein